MRGRRASQKEGTAYAEDVQWGGGEYGEHK